MNGIGLINATGQPAIAGSFHTLMASPAARCGSATWTGWQTSSPPPAADTSTTPRTSRSRPFPGMGRWCCSPELLGITEPRYGDFIAGNVLQQPITAMLARAGDRYFEHATFTARETTYCWTTRQGLVRAAADHLTPQEEAT